MRYEIFPRLAEVKCPSYKNLQVNQTFSKPTKWLLIRYLQVSFSYGTRCLRTLCTLLQTSETLELYAWNTGVSSAVCPSHFHSPLPFAKDSVLAKVSTKHFVNFSGPLGVHKTCMFYVVCSFLSNGVLKKLENL